MQGNGVLHSSKNQCWQTPDHVLDVVRQVGPIYLDPCSVESNPTGAERVFTPATDGLRNTWGGSLDYQALVYVNPPYGREVKDWADKAIAEAARGIPIVMLTASRPGAAWCQRVMASADVLCFWRGRIRFRGAPASAPFDSLFSAWNCRGRFVDAFREHGELLGRVS